MVLRELVVKRFETPISNLGYFCFGVEIKREKFIYLRNNPFEGKSIEVWKNRFYKAYRSAGGNHIFLSIEGISVFDSSFDRKKRRNIFLDKCSKENWELGRLARYGPCNVLESYLKEIIGTHKL